MTPAEIRRPLPLTPGSGPGQALPLRGPSLSPQCGERVGVRGISRRIEPAMTSRNDDR
jgi:hypothetical protein